MIFEVEVDNRIQEPKKVQLLIKQVLQKKRKERREPLGTKMAEVVAKSGKISKS
jgi:hypothetical protein